MLFGDEKASCITTTEAKINLTNDFIQQEPICVAMRGRNPENPNDRTPGIETEQRLEPNNSGKTNCLTTVGKDNLILYPEHPTVHNMQPRSGDPKKGGTGRLSWKDGKTYCLDTGNTNAVEVPVTVTDNYIQLEGVGYEQDNRIYFEE